MRSICAVSVTGRSGVCIYITVLYELRVDGSTIQMLYFAIEMKLNR